MLDRAKQVAGAVEQVKDGDTVGGAMEAINAATGIIKGLSENITKPDGTRATMNDIRSGNFKVNNDFYVSGNIRAGFNKSKSSTTSHTESAVVTTMKPMNENSSITYNNVNNITYQGTQAQGGTFIYNNVANIQKEAVELRNRYSSESSGFGVGVSVGIGSNGQIKSNGISGNISANRSNRNTDETIHANGSFKNVNEVHNNTGSMVLNGFNQEGGKVTGNIGNLVVESRQNTSTTTGSSKGVNLGISANGVPSSVTINAGRTNGNRAFVDNQSTFVVGEGSNLHVGTVENTGAVIGKEGNSTFKIDTYVGKDIQNYDTMTTTGGSIGVSLGGKPKITNVGFNQDSRDKQGITRNTVVGDVEIAEAEGSPINRDLGKANEITKDTHRSTNINVEPQVIEYISNPAKFKEDLEVAILEGKATGETVLKSIENIVNGGKEDIGDPERRAINEIKEAVIRVKTAPQMESIAKAKDLNSPNVLKELDIAAIEKYDPYDPNLPIKVRQRVEKTLKDGKIPGVFYDEITNKIFVYKGMEDDLKIRAGIAREWKISEDLKNEKGKPNEEGRLKATVAGELAYDDMMKRGREGKTESISTDRFADAVMDVNSEVTADDLLKDIKKGLTDTAKWIKNTPVYKEGEKIVKNPIGYSVSVGKQVGNEIGYRSIQGWNEVNKIGASKEKKEQLDRNTQNAKADRNRRNKEAVAQEEKERQQTERRKKEDKKQRQDNNKSEKSKNHSEEVEYKFIDGQYIYIKEGEDYGYTSDGNIYYRKKNDFTTSSNMTSSVPTEKKENPIISTGKNIITGGVLFIGGTWTAISEDVTYGVYKPIEINKPSYQLGRVVGHTVSTVGGTLGAIGGKGLEEVGIIAVPETAGLSLGITGAGYIVSGYSGGVAVKGSIGVGQSLAKLSQNSLNSGESGKNNSSSSSSSKNNNNVTNNNSHNQQIKDNYNQLSEHEKNMFQKYEKSGWNGQVSGGPSHAGGTFKNDGSRNSAILPTENKNGKITYKKFDINQTTTGRDSSRFIKGSDGSVYYTNDHYKTFTRIK